MEYEYWCDLIEQIHNGAGFDPETRGGEPTQIWGRPLQGVHVILPQMSEYSNWMKICVILESATSALYQYINTKEQQ